MYIVYEPTKEEVWFSFARERIAQAMSEGQLLEAQAIAVEWADIISSWFGLKRTGVWKFFKRALVARWFGRVESKRFPPGWSVGDALQYAYKFKERSVRFSLFPEDIACHAVSYHLPASQISRWADIIAQADNSVAMEMFPEASTDDSICFRRYTTLFGEVTFYEAGTGQAMYVFEQERGQHPVVLAEKQNHRYAYTPIVPDGCDSNTVFDIEAKLRSLVQTHDMELDYKCRGLCRSLGIDYVSIEGYYDPTRPRQVIVVDLDLPFDFVFMISALSTRQFWCGAEG